MKILFYTFRVFNNTSFKIGKLLEDAGQEVLWLAPQFSFYRTSELPKGTLFLGFGDFAHTARKMRLETLAQNKYGRQSVIPGKEEVLPLFHDFSIDDSSLYLSTAETNGPCNRAAYFFASEFGSEQSAFVHIPHLFDKQIARKALLDLRQQWQDRISDR